MDNIWKILFTGDIAISESIDENFVDQQLAKVISEHNYVSCNFEAPMPSEKSKPIRKIFSPNVFQDVESANHVKKAGFNVINLANNHMYDFGQEGLKSTFESFPDQIKIGAGLDFESAYELQVTEINNVKIGFLSFCELEFGALTSELQNRGGYAWINHPTVNYRIYTAKEQVDILIVQAHTGIEKSELPLPEWRSRYRSFIDAGADLVIGHHPHVPQGWELYKEKPIFFSLGNFYVDLLDFHPLWNYGYAVSVEFDGSKLLGYEIIPIKREDHKVLICKNQSYLEYLDYLCKILNSEKYLDIVNKHSIEYWNQHHRYLYSHALNNVPDKGLLRIFWRVLRRILGKIYIHNNFALLHNIRTESHKWSSQRALVQLEENESYNDEFAPMPFNVGSNSRLV